MSNPDEQPTTSISRSGGFVFFLASAGVNALNFVFHIVVSRALGPDDYSALGALLAILVIIAVPLSALQLACAQAQARAAADVRLGKVFRKTTKIALAIFVVLLAGTPLINDALHLTGLKLAALVALWVLFSTIATVPQGVLIGGLQFKQVAVSTFLGVGLARVVLGVVTGQLGGGIEGALTATVIAQLITLLLLLVPLRHRLSSHGDQLEPSPGDGLLSIGALTGLAALTAVDTVVARNTLPTREAGIYVAAATAGRITLFVPGALALIAFPRFSAAAERGESSDGLLLRSTAAVMGMGLVAATVLAVFPDLVVSILFGDEYKGSTGPLPILGLTGALLGVVNLFSYFHIAHRAWAALIGWGGTALIAVGVLIRPSIDPHSLALTMLGITAACLLISISAALLVTPAQTESAAHVPSVDLESGTVIPAPASAGIELA